MQEATKKALEAVGLSGDSDEIPQDLANMCKKINDAYRGIDSVDFEGIEFKPVGIPVKLRRADGAVLFDGSVELNPCVVAVILKDIVSYMAGLV